MHISTKYQNLKSNFSSTIAPLISEYNAINLADGYTGFHCNSKLINLVEKHLREGLNQIAPFQGEMALRKKVAQKTEELYSRVYQPQTEVTITAGVQQAMFTAISALVKEGDEVIVFEPANEYCVPAIQMNGAQPVFVPMKEPDFHIDWEQVQMMINSKTRMIIINTPHNPTGWVMKEIDMLRLQRMVNGTKIVILSEETFEHIVFDEESHQSAALYPILAERSIIIASFGESYHVTGWQIGFCLAPEEIMREFRKVHQVMVQSVNSPFQLALADFMEEKEEYRGLRSFYQERRNFFLDLMEESKFKPIVSQGTFFQLFDFSEASDEADKDFAIRLIKELGVAVMPISAFLHEKSKRQVVRINYAQPDEILIEAANRLKQL
nr:methionine aminotransferase [uncultured Carboxylicivirga sp.]